MQPTHLALRVRVSDYEEDPIEAPVAAAAEGEAPSTTTEQKGSYVGVHSTGFRDFLLKPELLRAISDLGFEHPSEGTPTSLHSQTSHQPLTDTTLSTTTVQQECIPQAILGMDVL